MTPRAKRKGPRTLTGNHGGVEEEKIIHHPPLECNAVDEHCNGPLLPTPEGPMQFYVADDVDRADVWRLAELAATLMPLTSPDVDMNCRIVGALGMASRLLFEAEQEVRESHTGHQFFDAEACGGEA